MAHGAGLLRRYLSSPLRIVAVLVVAIAASLGADHAFAMSMPEWPAEWSVAAFERLIRSWGMWGVAASIGLMVIHSFIPFPAEFVAIANGMVYGPVWGTAITWTGAMLGALLAFGLARKLGRPFVARMVLKKDWQRLDDWLARQGAAAVFFSRFIPVIAFNLINYAAGLTRISWTTFLWATGLGILPMTTLMVILGAQAEHLPWSVWLLLMAGGLVLWLVARRMLPWFVSAEVERLTDRGDRDS